MKGFVGFDLENECRPKKESFFLKGGDPDNPMSNRPWRVGNTTSALAVNNITFMASDWGWWWVVVAEGALPNKSPLIGSPIYASDEMSAGMFDQGVCTGKSVSDVGHIQFLTRPTVAALRWTASTRRTTRAIQDSAAIAVV